MFLEFLSFDRALLCIPGLYGIHYVERAGLELGVMFLLLHPEYWDYKPMLSYLCCSTVFGCGELEAVQMLITEQVLEQHEY